MELTCGIGNFPYRMAIAGGWIDQPFVSRLNPCPPGSMVVVSLEPTVRFMDRSGMASGTRQVALRLWNGSLPKRNPAKLVRELYAAENIDKPEPSGSQDMIGLIYPGISRLDYDTSFEGGYFPGHIESNRDPRIARWVEQVVHMIPVAQRPAGYNPLGIKRLEPEWIRRLGQSGRDCFNAIIATDMRALGASMNECMRCWAAILPHTVRHPAIEIDLAGRLNWYQSRYPGAMYSGCGGGYLLVVSDEPVPGSFRIKVRIA
jgi:hypothetical protein